MVEQSSSKALFTVVEFARNMPIKETPYHGHFR
jgi:hypothetical protein